MSVFLTCRARAKGDSSSSGGKHHDTVDSTMTLCLKHLTFVVRDPFVVRSEALCDDHRFRGDPSHQRNFSQGGVCVCVRGKVRQCVFDHPGT